MQSSQIPSKFQIPFANGAGSGYIRQIPVASQISVTPGAASLTDGFPPLTFISEGSGGIPPFGQDMNGILNEITAWIQWGNAGAPVIYDATFSAAIGGYPKGTILTSAAGGSWWLSTAENNATDPDTGGAGWLYLSYGLTYAGNPNGNVAGVAATNGALASSLLWDTTHSLLWVCTTTGTATTAVWATSSPQAEVYWCGTSTGTGNAQIVSGPIITFAIGTDISWRVGASQTNTGATSVTVNAFGAFPLLKDSPSGPITLSGGELIANNIVSARFDGTSLHLTMTAIGTAAMANASSNTGRVAGVQTGMGITVGHLATFADTSGTVQDGGPVFTALAPLYINSSQVVGTGIYLVDTSTGAITLTLPASPGLGNNVEFIDAAGTWATNNLTVAHNGHTIMGSAADLICNVGGEVFRLWYNGSDWRIE